jgi:cellulose synthase/poly-beta-1,6-N-acetylglucosamine synthase-like glycosyltransferase
VSDPPVCVILPVLDEYDAIDACIGSLRAQDYRGDLTVIAADGGSQDGTLDLLARWASEWPSFVAIDNPDRIQARGIWLAALACDAEILVRADAHTTYAPDYVARSVEALLNSDAVAVGGPMRPRSSEGFGAAVAEAMMHPLGVGPAPFHSGLERAFVDTTYLGAFRRRDFLDIGGMRTLPSQVAEDADLYYRWRKSGRRVLLDPGIRSSYTPRQTPGALARQFYRYGRGKADMLIVNREFPSARPLAPLALVVGIGIAGLLASVSPLPILLVLGTWIGTLTIAMRFRLATVAAAMIMHLAYGFGLFRGLLRRPSAVRAAVKENTQPE